jgi:hypothetical protein
LQGATAGGYQWKQVFLPEGTVLRASFDRQPYYAVVEATESREAGDTNDGPPDLPRRMQTCLCVLRQPLPCPA